MRRLIEKVMAYDERFVVEFESGAKVDVEKMYGDDILQEFKAFFCAFIWMGNCKGRSLLI